MEIFDVINKSFFEQPFKWAQIKNNCQQFVCYHGDNDPYVKKEIFNYISDSLSAKKIIISNGGHLNASAGYHQFSQLLIYLKQILNLG